MSSRLEAPATWPAEAKEVYDGLQTYRIVGASACVAAIMQALQAVAEYVRITGAGNPYGEVFDAGARFCALKPSTAAYANAVRWLLTGLDREADAQEVSSQIEARVKSYAGYRRDSLARIVEEAYALLPAHGRVLIHDYSSTVLAVMDAAGQRGTVLTAFVTAGEPVDQGPKVAQVVSAAGHHVVYLPDAGIGRIMGEVGLVLSGVETLFRNGDLANTVGTYPIALVAREAGVPLYGVTERMKIHPNASTVTAQDLTARVLHPWPHDGDALPAGAEVRSEVLDLTPAALVTGYVTEEGVLGPSHVSEAAERLYAALGASMA